MPVCVATMPSCNSTLEIQLASGSTRTSTSSDTETLVIRLFDQTQARLSGYILSFGLSSHDAEDIVQETFLALFHHLGRGRPRENLNGWLFRVAHNLALKKRLANKTHPAAGNHEQLLTQCVDPGHNAEEQLVFSQTHRCLSAVFKALPELDRRCLHLRAEGLKYRQIARTLGISVGAVSNSLSRSLLRLNRATGGGEK